MPMETELKYIGANLDDVRHRLQTLDADFQGKRFESNTVFDDDARSLKVRGVLVRLRDDGRRILTVKRPPEGPVPQGVKAWDEHETRVDNPEAVAVLLQTLGLAPAFAYEKLREEWGFMGCHICLDQLPFGFFVEIEGPPEAIPEAARALGLDLCEPSTANYHELNRQYRRDAGLPPQDSFTFEPGQRRAFIERWGIETDSGQNGNRP